MAANQEIRRNGDGSIDMAFYKARAGTLRDAARKAFLRRLCRGVLSGAKLAAWYGTRAASTPAIRWTKA